MSPWSPPAGLVGDSTFIRASLGILGPQQYRCPARDAMACRPNLRAPRRVRHKRELLESFTMGPFMAAMDLIEDRGFSSNEALRAVSVQPGRPIHDGVVQWTTRAVRAYQEAFPADREPSPRPVRGRWSYRKFLKTPDERGARRYEINAWGRCYASVDGGCRELRLITNRHAARTRADAEIAVAALVVARGEPGPVPRRVRIIQFGILEGTAETLFDGTVAAADEMYRLHGKQALGSIVSGVDYRPGTACVDCPYAGICPALPRLPGLLGLVDRSRPRRSWSATNARSYRVCPARAYLRQQRLPVDTAMEQSAAAERGRAVHAFLELRHASGAGRCCDRHVPPDWVPMAHDLSDRDRDLGARLLRHHSEVCPLRHAAEVRGEPDLVFDDPDADVVVLAKPDLLYREHGAWVWREVKTSASDRRRSGDVLMEYPQLALGVVLIARGAFGVRQGRVELEVLRPGGVDLQVLDPLTVSVRARAERVVTEHVRAWHADDRFVAVPGDRCRRCEVSRWCTAKDGAMS